MTQAHLKKMKPVSPLFPMKTEDVPGDRVPCQALDVNKIFPGASGFLCLPAVKLLALADNDGKEKGHPNMLRMASNQCFYGQAYNASFCSATFSLSTYSS
jgi:hypothetical protein